MRRHLLVCAVIILLPLLFNGLAAVETTNLLGYLAQMIYMAPVFIASDVLSLSDPHGPHMPSIKAGVLSTTLYLIIYAIFVRSFRRSDNGHRAGS